LTNGTPKELPQTPSASTLCKGALLNAAEDAAFDLLLTPTSASATIGA
jgi:hypothetical protein